MTQFECAMYSLTVLNNTPTFKKWEISHKGQDIHMHLKNQNIWQYWVHFPKQVLSVHLSTGHKLSSYPLVPTTAY